MWIEWNVLMISNFGFSVITLVWSFQRFRVFHCLPVKLVIASGDIPSLRSSRISSSLLPINLDSLSASSHLNPSLAHIITACQLVGPVAEKYCSAICYSRSDQWQKRQRPVQNWSARPLRKREHLLLVQLGKTAGILRWEGMRGRSRAFTTSVGRSESVGCPL